MRNQQIAATAIVALACGGMAAYSATELASSPAEQVQLTASVEVSEDSADWNCATMGNHVCGPDVVPIHLPEWCFAEQASVYAPEWQYTPGSRVYLSAMTENGLCNEVQR